MGGRYRASQTHEYEDTGFSPVALIKELEDYSPEGLPERFQLQSLDCASSRGPSKAQQQQAIGIILKKLEFTEGRYWLREAGVLMGMED